MKKMIGIVFAMATAAFVAVANETEGPSLDARGPGAKKYVAFGWEHAYITPQDFLDHAEEYMKTPLDGVRLNVNGGPGTPRPYHASRQILSAPRWTKEMLADLVPPMRKMLEYPCYRESFVTGWLPPQKRLAWTDDAAWSIASNNLRAVAWLAREAGWRGISWDVEDYWKQQQLFRVPEDPPYDELCGIVRRRAREIFGGIFGEYPGITVFMYWFLSDAPYRYGENDLPGLMRERGDLWHAFVNGVLDVMPPTATIVDGQEDAYKFETRFREFAADYVKVFNHDLALVAEENRRKYLSQVSLAFGQYVDSYVNDEKSDWYFGPKDGSRITRFAENLRGATSATAKYVWFWAESGSWIKWKDEVRNDPERLNRKCAARTWEEALPGLGDMMREIKEPGRHLIPRIRREAAEGKLADLAGAGGFDFWNNDQKDKAGTTERLEEGRLLVAKGLPKGGIFHRYVNVKPGDAFFVTGSMKGEGAKVTVSYRSPEKKWLFGYRGQCIPGAPDADGWRKVEVFITVPHQDIAEMVFGFGPGPQKPDETASFRDFHLYPVRFK